MKSRFRRAIIFSFPLLFLFISLLFSGRWQNTEIQAAEPNIKLYGQAWSSNIGWINFSGVAENGQDYGVEVKVPSGNLEGEAWSSNIGWLKFDRLDDFPIGDGTKDGDVNAKIILSQGESAGRVQGWARFCAGAREPENCSGGISLDSGGWDGFVSMSGTLHPSPDISGNGGVTYDESSGRIVGKAWGGDVVGWIDFVNVWYGVPPPENFNYELTNSTITAWVPSIPQGTSDSISAISTWLAGPSEGISLTTPGSIDNGNISIEIIDNNPCIVSSEDQECSSTVRISVDSDATLGSHSFQISGESESEVERITTATFEVVEPELPPEVLCSATGNFWIYETVTWEAVIVDGEPFESIDWFGNLGNMKSNCSDALECPTSYLTVGKKEVQVSVDGWEPVECTTISIIARIQFREL